MSNFVAALHLLSPQCEPCLIDLLHAIMIHDPETYQFFCTQTDPVLQCFGLIVIYLSFVFILSDSRSRLCSIYI